MPADRLVPVVDREQVGAARCRRAVERGQVLVEAQRPPPRPAQVVELGGELGRSTNNFSGSGPGGAPK